MGKLDKLFIVYLSSYPDSSEADCIFMVSKHSSLRNLIIASDIGS
jgi:hypothetical protein